MKKKRGLSYDEKRDKMLKIFHDSKTVFNYEEIEKLSIKAGIPFPNVKEILNSLKADNLIECEKIGAGVFYWAFPSKAIQIFQGKIAASRAQIDFYTTEIANLETQIEEGQKGREETEEREQLVSRLSQLQSEEEELKKEIDRYIRFDPERVDLLVKQNDQLKKGINLQTDNLQQIKKFIKKQQPGIKNSQIETQYSIPADLDYVE